MDPFSQHLQDLALAHAEIARAGIEAGKREDEAVRRAAQNLVTIAEHYPDAMLPTPLTAAILVLKEAYK